MELREYQKASLAALWRWFRENPTGAPLLVLPTGAGKSVIIAEIAKRIAEQGHDRRVLVLAHRKELLSQNADKLSKLWPFGSIGVYSAGLSSRDTSAQVIFAGVQSVFRRAEELGKFSLVIIDECHLIPNDGDGMYRTLIEGLQRINPEVRFCGTTATPYRMGSGFIAGPDNLFTDVAYDANLRELIEAGYLSPLISKGSVNAADLSSVMVRGGEYVAEQVERAFNREDLVEAACAEVVEYGEDRQSWLIFGAGVAHAAKVAAVLNRVGVKTGLVTGDTPPLFRARILDDFKSGDFRALVNCDVLTTGFDHPNIDLIAVMRATKSTSLWVQLCGRGSRMAPGKKNCLILDFGGNALAHGPLDTIRVAYRRNPLTGATEGRVETAPTKECPICRSVVSRLLRECPDCGAPFPDRSSHDPEASRAAITSMEAPKFEVAVLNVDYKRHKNPAKPIPTMRVDYTLSQFAGVPVVKVSEWVCFEHAGFARQKAMDWWCRHGASCVMPSPMTVDEGVARTAELKTPKRIVIQQDGKYWRVLKVLEFEEVEEYDEEMGNI